MVEHLARETKSRCRAFSWDKESSERPKLEKKEFGILRSSPGNPVMPFSIPKKLHWNWKLLKSFVLWKDFGWSLLTHSYLVFSICIKSFLVWLAKKQASHDHLLLIHLLRHRAFRMFDDYILCHGPAARLPAWQRASREKHKRRKLIIQARLGLAPFCFCSWCQSRKPNITDKKDGGQAFSALTLVILLPNGQNFQSCFFGTEQKVGKK